MKVQTNQCLVCVLVYINEGMNTPSYLNQNAKICVISA